MTLKISIDNLQAGLALAQAWMPIGVAIATVTGVPGATAAAGILNVSIEAANALLERIENGQLPATPDERAAVLAILANLEEQNEGLAARIAAL